MRGRRILFYDPDHKVQRIAERALLATQSEVVLATDEDDLDKKTETERFDLLMVNFDPPVSANSKFRPTCWTPIWIILSIPATNW